MNPGNSGGPLLDRNGRVVGHRHRAPQSHRPARVRRRRPRRPDRRRRRGRRPAAVLASRRTRSPGYDTTGIDDRRPRRAAGARQRPRPRGADGAGALRGQEGHRRPGPPPGADDRRAARPRSSARRRRARPRQDDGHQDPRRGDRRRVQADPVHPGPRPGRPRRDPDLQPEDRRVRDVARPRVHEPAPRRRDQPRPRQGPVRAARGDAGAPGHDRPRDLQGPRPVPRARDPEPDRDRGDVRPPGGAGRPVHAQGARRLPVADRGVRHRRADDRTALQPVSKVLTTDELLGLQQQADAVYVDPALYRVRGPPRDRDP